jgi:hypothetical protein
LYPQFRSYIRAEDQKDKCIWQIKEEKLKSYQEYLSTMTKEFEEIKFTHLRREGNHFADVLETLVGYN